jgi:NADH-quinone oxidoreductase subunit J
MNNHIPAQIFMYIAAAFAVFGALGAAFSKNPIRGAMSLLVLILSIAVMFLSLHAEFLAFIQLIVYAGAIVVLFLFVIMLLGPSATSPADKRGLLVRVFGGSLFGLSALGVIALSINALWKVPLKVPAATETFGGVNAFGEELFSKAVAPFELSSALLMVAVIGAVAIARGKQPDAPATTVFGAKE